jgi:integrase
LAKHPHGAHTNDGKPYSATYLRTLNNQLTAILNHAERYYGLSSNPAMRTVKMGGKEARTMNFWTKDEYLRFSDATVDAPRTFVIFEVLYWTGIREGELLALTPDSFDWKKSTIAGLATVCWTVS